jgi:hypothetical protein
MTLASIARMALFAISAIALIDASLRVAERMTSKGLERIVAAAPLAAATAVVQSLLLGLVGLGTHPVALSAAAIVTWFVVRLVVWRNATRPLKQFLEWLASLDGRQLAALGAIAAMALVCVALFLRHPFIGHDSVVYHVPEAIDWVHNGRPGSQETVMASLPVESYPLTDEVLLSWQFGLAGSLIPLAIWPVALTLLAGIAAFLGLRRRGASVAFAALGIAAFVTVPHLFANLNGMSSDAGSLAWMLSAVALCVCARTSPALLCSAIVAASLSLGTRTTTLPILVGFLGWALWRERQALRPIAKWLWFSAALGVGAGGVWYIRNLIVHGSPFWPLVPVPWGDPGPEILEQSRRFRDLPVTTIKAMSDYTRFLAGGLVLLGGGVLAPLVSRSRAVLIAAGATITTFLLWTNVPFTGLSEPPLGVVAPLGTSRYLMPSMAAGMTALVLAAEARNWFGWAAVGVLGLALAWNVAVMPQFEQAPSLLTLTAVAVVGAFAATALPAARLSALVPRIPGIARTAAIGGAIAIVLTAAAPGYVRRHADSSPLAGELTRWLSDQPAYKEGGEKISMTERLIGPLAGDELKHETELIPAGESCEELEDRVRDEWVVVTVEDPTGAVGVEDNPLERGCLGDLEPVYEDGSHAVFYDGPVVPVPTPSLPPVPEVPAPTPTLVPSVSPVADLVP